MTTTKTTKFLGTTHIYTGSEFLWMRGLRERVVAVMKGSDPDADGYYLNDDESIQRARGIASTDRVEVQPWMEKEKRFSFVTSDPKASDLKGLATSR